MVCLMGVNSGWREIEVNVRTAAKLQQPSARVGLQQIADHDIWHRHESGDSWRMSQNECVYAAEFAGRRARREKHPFEWRSPDKYRGGGKGRARERRCNRETKATRLRGC